jgi:hypothetical protein
LQQRTLVVAGCAVIAAISLWLRAAVPVSAIALAPHDDLLFVRLAYYLGGGQWLGPYDQFTLAKGMAYSAFTLAAFAAGLPLKLAEQGAYLASAGLAAWLAARLTHSRAVAFLLFAILAFSPFLWIGPLSRVIREGLYISVSLAGMMLTAAVLLPRAALTTRARLALLVCLGIVAAIFWLTREEGVWLFPAVAFLILAAAVREIRANLPAMGWAAVAGRLARAVAMAVVPISVFAANVAAVAAMNERAYGAFMINEVQSEPFRAAFGALVRVQHDDWQRYVIFPRQARERAYSVSPAAQELRATLDGEIGEGWRRAGCAALPIEPCTEIPAGWFLWALRDAVAEAGHYASARESLSFYERLAAEINAACDSGRIPCTPFHATLVPPFRWHYVADALARFPALFAFLVDPSNIGPQPSQGPHFVLDLFADLVGPLAHEPSSYVVLTLTVTTPGELPALLVRDRDGMPLRSEVRLEQTMERATDPTRAGRDTRLEISTDCIRPSCDLMVKWGATEKEFRIDQIAAGSLLAAPDLDIIIRRVLKRSRSGDLPVASELLHDLQLRLTRAIAKAYALALPFLTAGALLGVLASTSRRFQQSTTST